MRPALWRGRNEVRVHVVVPEGFDDPGQPTGGNIYDRRVCAGLAEAGWEVLVATVARLAACCPMLAPARTWPASFPPSPTVRPS